MLCTSDRLRTTQRLDEFERQRLRLSERGVRLEVWAREDLSERLRRLPLIVHDFFGRAWVDRFCGADALALLGPRLGPQDVVLLRRGLGDLYGRDLVQNGETRRASLPPKRGLAVHPPGSRLAGSHVLLVDPNDDKRAYIVMNEASSVIVEAGGETEAGEKMATRIELRSYCWLTQQVNLLNPADPVPTHKRLVDIWKGELALQRMSLGPDTVLNPNLRLRALAIGRSERALEDEAWGTRLTAAQREERDAFATFVRGGPLSANAKAALSRLSARGRRVRVAEPQADAQIRKSLQPSLIRTVSIVANGRDVRMP